MRYEDVREIVATGNRVLAATGLADPLGVTVSLGHVSMRVPDDPDLFVVKGRGYIMDALAVVRPEEMILCDREGYMVEGLPGTAQCVEVKIHSCIYKTRPDVQSIVHVHPRYSILMTLLQVPLRPMCIEGTTGGGFMTEGPIPVWPHMNVINTEEEGMGVATTLGNSAAVMLEGHGAVTVGSSIDSSITRMLQLEEQARMNYLAYAAAGPNYRSIPQASIDEQFGRTPLGELPHFVEPLATRRPGNGVWKYYEHLVAQDLAQ